MTAVHPFDPTRAVPTAQHVNTETLPWVRHPSFETDIRILQANRDPDFYVIHSLFEPEDNDGPTETVFVICGGVEYFDEAGTITGVSNAAVMLQNYLDACDAAGLPRPEGIIT
jgi:hypothetical protein